MVGALLRGTTTRRAYALYLRNLLPAYRELERGLEHHRHWPPVAVIARPALYRAAAIVADLEQLGGAGWDRELAVLEAGRDYGAHVAAVAETAAEGLIGHAWVRYFGDLSGGQILERQLARNLGLEPRQLQVYAFPGVEEPGPYKAELRAALDRVAPRLADPERVLLEAEQAFRLTIEVSEAVSRAIR